MKKISPVVSAGYQVEVDLTGEGHQGRGEVEAEQSVTGGLERLKRLEARPRPRPRLVKEREAETDEPGQHQPGHSEARPEVENVRTDSIV